MKRLPSLLLSGALLVVLQITAYSSNLKPSQDLSLETRHLAQAEAYFQKGEFHLAAQEYEQALTPHALSLDPNLEMVRLMLGMAYSKSGQPQKAVQEWEKMVQNLKAHPENAHYLADAYFNLGIAYHDQNQSEKTIQAFNQAVLLIGQSLVKGTPLLLDSYTHLADIYAKQARWREMADTMEQAIKIDNQRSDLYDRLGYAYLRLADWKKAQAAAQRSEELKPQGYSGHHLLGMAYCAQGKSLSAEVEKQHLIEHGYSAAKLQEAIETFCRP